MARKFKIVNPFYFALVFVGVIFCITACVFGIMTVRGMYPEQAAQTSSPLLEYMDQNGFKLLMIELAALAVSTVGAIGTDNFWMRLAERRNP